MNAFLMAKAAGLALTSEKGRSALVTILCALLMPLILIALAIMGMADGAAEHNRAAVMVCFDDSIQIPDSADRSFQEHILEMRECFAALDRAAEALEYQEEEDVEPLDVIRMKAVFYGLLYEQEQLVLTDEEVAEFMNCFVEYEERTREISTEEGEDGETKTETYMAAFPITDLQQIFRNTAAHLHRSISYEDQAECMEVYYMVQYGDVSRAAGSDELIGILIGSDSKYIGGTAGSPFSFDWRSCVTSEFTDRVNPISGRQEHHTGLDMAAPRGTGIRAVAAGTVILARYGHPSYGNYLVIDHGGGVTTLYAHCTVLTVGTGQTVSAGEEIAKVGSTGNSTGNHLHLEVRENGTLVNPRTFLQ